MSCGLTVFGPETSITCHVSSVVDPMVWGISNLTSKRETQVRILFGTCNFSFISEKCVESLFLIYAHLGTVKLKDLVEYLPTHNQTLTPTQGGGVSRAKIAKLESKGASEMNLANDTKQQTACRGHEEPCEGPEPPQALIG